MSVCLSACVSVSTTHAPMQGRRERVRFPGIGVTGGWEPPSVGSEPNSGHRQKQQVLFLTTAASPAAGTDIGMEGAKFPFCAIY